MTLEEKIKIITERGFMIADTPIWYKQFLNHQHAATKRGLVSHLKFSDYMDKIQEADLVMPEQVGKANDAFQLARLGDVGDYEVENCRFITSLQNRQEARRNGRFDTANVAASERRLGQTKETSEQVRKMAETVTGRTKQNHAGKAAQADKLAKEFVVISPDGVEHRGKNLFEFCKANGLDQSLMSKVARGAQSNHKGWTGRYLE